MNIYTIGGNPTEHSTLFHVPDEPKIITKCAGCSTVTLLSDLWYGKYCCYRCYKVNKNNLSCNMVGLINQAGT